MNLDKNIFVSYKAGAGGEFFCSHLHSVMVDSGASLVTPSGFKSLKDSNQYSYNQGMFDQLKKMYASLAYMEAGMDILKLKDTAKDFENPAVIKPPYLSYYHYLCKIIDDFYQVFLSGVDESTAWNNLTDYFSDVFSIDAQNKYMLNSIHYMYQTPIQRLIPGSKMIHLYANQMMSLNCTLLFIFKRLHFYKQSIKRLISEDWNNYDYLLQWNKDSLTNILIERDYTLNYSIIRQYDLVIDIRDLYFNHINFDRQISDYIGHNVCLDYQNIDSYKQKNSELFLNNFGLVYGNDITKQQALQAGVEYIDKFFHNLNS